MKQVNFTHPGGFPLEQETLERLQTAYRSELFEALKGHLSIKTNKNYTVTPATIDKKGWSIIHQEEKNPEDETGAKILQGILYPIEKGTPTQFLKTTRTGTNLTYGTGVLQTAYFDYEAKYITPDEYTNRPVSPQITDALAIYYYDLNDFKIVKDIEAIETILNTIKANIVEIETDVSTNYLPLNGSKAMKGDLDLGPYKLSKLDIREGTTANVRVTDFRLGSNLGRALVNDSTKLTLNAGSDWQNTSIGGNVYLENLNTSPEDFTSLKSSANSLLLMDNASQVMKSNNLLNSLLGRISELEKKPATAVPKGMIAIWGKPKPFPEGWEEYTPLAGRMPVGFDNNQFEFNTLGFTDGKKRKQLTVEELPPHTHDIKCDVDENNENGKYAIGGGEVNNRTSFTQPTGSGNDFSILNPYRVVFFIEYTGNSSDTTAPTTPTNLKATNIGTKSLTLNWTASTDNVGVTSYLIYKDNSNTPLAELGKDSLTYNVTGLSASTTYTFKVRAKDAAGNLSIPATLIQATIAADLTAPTVPSALRSAHNGQGFIQVEWSTSQDDDSPIYYELSRSVYGSLFTILKKDTTTYYNEQVKTNGTYTYKVRAIDPSGNASDYKETSITINSL